MLHCAAPRSEPRPAITIARGCIPARHAAPQAARCSDLPGKAKIAPAPQRHRWSPPKRTPAPDAGNVTYRDWFRFAWRNGRPAIPDRPGKTCGSAMDAVAVLHIFVAATMRLGCGAPVVRTPRTESLTRAKSLACSIGPAIAAVRTRSIVLARSIVLTGPIGLTCSIGWVVSRTARTAACPVVAGTVTGTIPIDFARRTIMRGRHES